MVATNTLISLSLLLAVSWATPAARPKFANGRSRHGHTRQGNPYSVSTTTNAAAGDTGGPGGWAGIVQSGQTGVSTVSATIVVPTPSIPPSGNSGTQYGGCAWVGIDGYGLDILWQTGVSWWIEGSTTTFSGWWDWYNPEHGAATSFSGFSVSAGDTIAMTIVASGASSGTAYLENETTGQSVNQTLTGQPALQQVSAEWILEDFGLSGGNVPFAAFTPVQFTSCGYTDSAGSNLGLSGGTVINGISDSSGSFANTVQSGDSELTVSYTGNAAWS